MEKIYMWSLVVSIVSATISVGAIGVSLYTFWVTEKAPSKISGVIGNSFGLLAVILDHKNIVPAVAIPIIFTNSGAQVGVVSHLALRLTYPDKSWDLFQPIREIEQLSSIIFNTTTESKINNNEVFSGVAVPPKTSVHKILLFTPISSSNFKFPENFTNAKAKLLLGNATSEWEILDSDAFKVDPDATFRYKQKDQRIRYTERNKWLIEKLNN